MAHRAGFVNIIGNPNVGKSTLMNALIGEKLSLVTKKAQTTRHRILGILNGEDYQIIFSDTPGIVRPAYKLHQSMMKTVNSAFSDADIMLYVTDIAEKSDKNKQYIDRLRDVGVPVVVAINKSDLATEQQILSLRSAWLDMLPDAIIIPISALHHFNLDTLISTIQEHLPENPRYYPEDDLTDKPERFFVSEIIRGQIFQNYKKEIPYSCEVSVISFKEEAEIVRIEAVIHVIRDSQKGIIIGHKGQALKKTGTSARLEIEKFLGKKVFLGLSVKLAADWRNNEKHLKSFGY